MGSFGLPLTETPTIENKLKITHHIPQVRCLLAFLRYERHLMIREREREGNNCAQHRSKGTTPDTDEGGNNTQGAFAKGPEKTKRSAPR